MRVKQMVGVVGVGDATCDKNWRVRLPANYAGHFLRAIRGRQKTVLIYLATVDLEEVWILPMEELLLWREDLRVEGQYRVLNAFEIHGGQADMDRQGRFVMPRSVRESLSLANPLAGFRVLSTGPVRLLSPELFEKEKARVAAGPELRDLAVSSYREFRTAQGAEEAP